jgi:hypothetical protein
MFVTYVIPIVSHCVCMSDCGNVEHGWTHGLLAGDFRLLG